LQKQKMYSAIIIGGFALSITACLLISLYIRDELSFDRSYPDTDRIYRVDIQWWIFVFAGLIVTGIALATISFQSIKAALANPARNLRSE